MQENPKLAGGNEDEIVVPIKLDPDTFMRLRQFSAEVGQDPSECASALFRTLIYDDEFDRAQSKTFN